MNGVYFGRIHSFYDLNLILAPFTPAPAEPKLNFLEIPGMDGFLDLTEANGEVKYNSREFEFVFTVAPGDTLTFDERASMVSTLFNGKTSTITLDRDPDYYWYGRCSVSEYNLDRNVGQITIKATVRPYKTKQEPTEVTAVLSSKEQTVMLENSGRMAVVPFIDCTGACTIDFYGTTYNLEPGVHQIPEIRLEDSAQLVLQVSGSGTITFSWNEGAL